MGIKYRVNEDFFKTWSDKMAYILGFIVADGSLEDASYLRGKYLRVSSTDREILEKIRTVMSSEHNIVTIKPRKLLDKGKVYITKEKYLLRIGSHKIYNDLFNLGLYPNKSKSIAMPCVPLDFRPHFIRGYLDGDGCIYHAQKRQRLEVIFTSGSRLFLKELSALIGLMVDIKISRVLFNSRAFQIRYSTGDAVPLLKYLYSGTENKLYLERKYRILLNFLKSGEEKNRRIWN